MSVLATNRNVSSVQYVYTAQQIHREVLHFLSRLSKKYSLYLGMQTATSASNLLTYVAQAQAAYPADEQRRQLRKYYIVQAQGALYALDLQLSTVYNILQSNPLGCFEKKSGEMMGKVDAQKRLDSMCVKLGKLIDEESKLLAGVEKSLVDNT